MSCFEFKTVYLDRAYKDVLERFCLKKKLITQSPYYDADDLLNSDDHIPLTGLKTLFRLMVLYENIDSNSSIYDFRELIDRGIINEHNLLEQSKEDPNVYSTEYTHAAIDLMKIFRKDIIKYIRSNDRAMLRSLQLYAPNKELWKTIDPRSRTFFCTDRMGNKLELTKDFDRIVEIDDPRAINIYSENPSTDFIYRLFWNHDIDLDIGSIRDNLVEGLYHSEINKMSFASSIFSQSYQCQQTDYVDAIYYTVKARLPNEVNILPMPQTFEEVLQMRNSPYIKSFRCVMNEWSAYISRGEYEFASKIKKDIIRANKQLARLERFKAFSESPYVSVFNLLGSTLTNMNIPLSLILGGIEILTPYMIEGLKKKHGWVLLTK